MNEENVPIGGGIDIILSKNEEISFTGKWVELGMRKREAEGRRTRERPRGRTAGEKSDRDGEEK